MIKINNNNNNKQSMQHKIHNNNHKTNNFFKRKSEIKIDGIQLINVKFNNKISLALKIYQIVIIFVNIHSINKMIQTLFQIQALKIIQIFLICIMIKIYRI